MKVLIVDDSNSVAMVVAGMLEESGHEALRAKDGQDAITVLNQKNVDIILLDWNMPIMNGLEFLQFNLENKITKAPIVMMTTEDKPEKIIQALENGAVEYIMKPFTSDILISKINSVVS